MAMIPSAVGYVPAGGAVTLASPLNITADLTATDNALVVKDNPAVTRTTGQLMEVFDHLGNPIWSIPPAGGAKTYNDNVSAGTGVAGNFTGVDGPHWCLIFDINSVTLPNPLRVFAGTGVPAAGLAGSNNGDWFIRQDTPGTSLQRLYVKAAGAWTGVV